MVDSRREIDVLLVVMSIDKLTKNDVSSACKLISYDQAEVIPGIVNGTWFLAVSGQAPCANMEVILAPRIYIDCPEYWGIDVVGYIPDGICLKALKDFTKIIPLKGVTGSKGIEVVGQNKKDTFDVSGGCS